MPRPRKGYGWSKAYHEDNDVCDYYVDSLELGYMRVVIHYTEEFCDGVPSSCYARKLQLEVPIDMLNPDWETQRLKEEITRWKALLNDESGSTTSQASPC